jgi:hypothetical protein
VGRKVAVASVSIEVRRVAFALHFPQLGTAAVTGHDEGEDFAPSVIAGGDAVEKLMCADVRHA